tara:strand:+ start:566 stop:952 length:387 start_codon:yes stop_codon:yes gene_type:complete
MKNFKELYEVRKNAMSPSQRKALSRRMSKMAKSSGFQMKKKRAALKMRDPAKLVVAAKKKVMQTFRKNMAPDWNSLSPQQRAIIDQKIISKFGMKIDKMAAKAARTLKKGEMARVKAARASQSGDAAS